MTMREGLLFLTSACMSMVWRYALVNTVSWQFFHTPIPLLPSITTLLFSVLVTSAVKGLGWRNIQVVLIQFFCFIPAYLTMLHVYLDGPGLFPGPIWIRSLFVTPNPLSVWFSLAFVAGCVLLFWTCGRSLVYVEQNHDNLCARFDAGVAAFFGLFIVAFALRWQYGVRFEDQVSATLLLPFFLTSMAGLTLAGNKGNVHKEFLPGFRGVGVVLSFFLIVLAAVATTGSLFLPLLTLGAQAGYDTLRTVAEPLGPYLTRLLILLFAPRKVVEATATPSVSPDTQGPLGVYGNSWLSDSTREILLVVVQTFLGAVLVGVVLFLLWLLLMWLFTKTNERAKSREQKVGKGLLFLLLTAAKIIFLLGSYFIRGATPTKPCALEYYRALRGWGRRSGIRHKPHETPLEYSHRLQRRFPELKEEVQEIVDAFNQQVYGGIFADQRQLTRPYEALQKIRSPLNWGTRMKSLLFRGNEDI